MGRLRQKIESIMQADGVDGQVPLTILLQTAAVLYGGAVKLRNSCYDAGIFSTRRLPCRVISIGNITAGGTGKTPMTIHLAQQLRQMGYRPAVLSRGFGGAAESGGAVVSNGYEILCGPEIAGDEPVLIASKLKGIPVLVGSDRYRGGMRAVTEFDPDILVLDDAFQHRRLYRDVDLVLLDAGGLFGNGNLIPRGVLREPISGLHRGDGFVLTRSRTGKAGMAELMSNYSEKPVFRSDHEPYIAGIFDGAQPLGVHIPADHPVTGWSEIAGKRLFVFSGIARNREFSGMMERRVGTLAGCKGFPDHHPYTDGELEQLIKLAEKQGADLLATTEKDYVRIAGRIPGSLPIVVIGVTIRFSGNDESDFLQFIRRKLALARTGHDGERRKTEALYKKRNVPRRS